MSSDGDSVSFGRMPSDADFDSQLLARISVVVSEGDLIATLDRRSPNKIGQISPAGIEVTTERSAATVGGAVLVPAWMFNVVWEELREHGRVDREQVDRLRPGRKVKRSSIVFAILERLPEVDVVGRRPVVLGLRRD